MIRRFILILLAFAGWLPSRVIGQTLRDGSRTHHPVYFNHDGMWKTAMPTVKTDSTGCPCDSDWSPIHQLTTNDSYGLRIVAQGDNVIHCFWDESRAEILYARSLDGGVTYEPTRDIIQDTAYFQVGIDGLNVVSNDKYVYAFFVYRGRSSFYSPVWMLRSSDSGAHWQNPKQITVAKDSAETIVGAYASGDTLALFYVSKKLKGAISILYSTNAGEIWKWTKSKLPKGDEFRLAITSKYFYLIYVKQDGKKLLAGETAYRYSKNFGKSWGKEFVLSKPDSHSSFSPSVATGKNGSVYVTWLDGKYGSINGFGLSIIERHSTNHGKTWSGEKVLTKYPEASWPYLPYTRVIDAESKTGSVIGVSWSTDTLHGWKNSAAYHLIKSRVYIVGDSGWCPELLVTPDALYAITPTVCVTEKYIIVGWQNSIRSGFTECVRSIPIKARKITSVQRSSGQKTPLNAQLEQNYPNPFNPKTVIRYSLPVNSVVTLNVYNVLGQVVASLLENEEKQYGAQEVEFNAANLASGVYYYRLDVLTEDGESFSETKKLVVMK